MLIFVVELKIADILKTIELYKKKPDARKSHTINTLISNYRCQENIGDETVTKVHYLGFL